MYRRDLITAQIQKLAQVLARIVGLRLEGNIEESENLMTQSLLADFGINIKDLFNSDEQVFTNLIEQQEFPAEKLEMLSQFLYTWFESSTAEQEKNTLAAKLLLIYTWLGQKYHIVTLINLDREKLVRQYLNS